MVNVVLACCKDGGIGIKGKLPWSIKEELKLFKMITENGTVIMGYNTWESLPIKPLPNRTNVVLTTNNKNKITENYKNVVVLDDINIALKQYNNNQCFWIGGASIYNYLIDNYLITNLYISRIHQDYETDTKINIDKLYDKEHNIVSRQVFEKFTHLHVTYQKDAQLQNSLN